MKIHLKFLLCFAAVVLVMVGFLSFYVNLVLKNRVLEDQAEEYAHLTRQLATGVYLTARETEQNLFNQYNVREVAGAMLQDQEPVAKTLNVQSLLSTVPLNVTAVQSVLAIDLQGNRFFSGTLPEDQAETIERILSPELYDTFTLWLRDREGRIFLKKDVYQVFPLQYAGILVAQIDTPAFLSMLGMDMKVDGMLSVLTEQGNLLAQTGGMTEELLSGVLEKEPLTYRTVSERLVLDGGEYWLTVQPAVNRSWYALQLVPMQTMLAMPLSLGRAVWLGSLAIIAVAFALDVLVTHSITRNVKKLLSSIEEVSRGNFDAPIPVQGGDEIGELADRFRWMQRELKTVTGKMVLRATEKQQAEYEMLELKYRSLLAQISPHFLCNVLSSINALAVMGRTEQVSALSVQAARYLRDNLSSSERKYTTLGEEIQFVEEYVDLYRGVYSNPCDFQVDVCDEAVECRVPNMLLQPLVENALVHGRVPEEAQQVQHIRITARVEGEELLLQVSNDGQEISPEIIGMVEKAGADQEFSKKMKGFGLRGVLQRLRLLYGDRQSLQIRSEPGGWTDITLRLPCEIMKEA